MSYLALSSHGTVVARAPAATSLTFTDIAELGDITLPELSRNEFESTTQEVDIDSYVQGVLRRTPVTFPLNFIPSNATHDHLTGLFKALKDNTLDGYRFTIPLATPWIMICSGQVNKIAPKTPMDGKLAADVTLRLSSKFMIQGVVFG